MAERVPFESRRRSFLDCASSHELGEWSFEPAFDRACLCWMYACHGLCCVGSLAVGPGRVRKYRQPPITFQLLCLGSIPHPGFGMIVRQSGGCPSRCPAANSGRDRWPLTVTSRISSLFAGFGCA